MKFHAVDILACFRYTAQPMIKFPFVTWSVLATSLFFLAPHARGAEPVQPLIAELTRANAPLLQNVGEPGQPAPQLQEESGREPGETVADLFSLEELRNSTQDDSELALPDTELPEADIPLALNSKVEYFLYYFQTSGKASFSRWLSRSSRYIPMMKEILKREGMPEDLVYVAMIESGFQMHEIGRAHV